MALKWKISVIEEVKSLIIYNCTGNYRYDNLGGFGKPNHIETKNIEKTIFYITTPLGGDPIEVDASGSWPTTDDNLGYEVLPYQLGMQDELKSGKYTIKAEISGTDSQGNAFKKTDIFAAVFIKQIECCVDKAMKTVDKNAFKDPKQQAIIELNNLLESVCYDIKCGLTDKAVSTIEYIDAQCGCCGC